MDKKGMGWVAIITIVIILVGAGFYLYWQSGVGREIVKSTESTGCQLSIFQAGSFLGKLKEGELPNLPGCGKIPVEIKSETEKEIIEELAEYVFKAAKDFGRTEIFSKVGGRYCRRRYHPITFNKKGLSIPQTKLNSYVEKDMPFDMAFWMVDYQTTNIDTNKEYTILFMADYSEGWYTFVKNIFLSGTPLEERLVGENVGITFIQTDEFFKLDCDYPI